MSSHSVVLSPTLIQQKTKQQNITEIRHLNVWNASLGDVSILEACTQLEVLSLSVNKISSLKPFQRLIRLKELYLRNNEISSLSELRYLSGLKQLHVLWLCGNPCSLGRNYRLQVISMLPHVDRLDSQEVTSEEREQARRFLDRELYKRDTRELQKPSKERLRKEEPSIIGFEDNGSQNNVSPLEVPQSSSAASEDANSPMRDHTNTSNSSTEIAAHKRSKWNTNNSSEDNPLHMAKKQVMENHTYIYDANIDHSYQQMQSTLREMREKILHQDDQILKLQNDNKPSESNSNDRSHSKPQNGTELLDSRKPISASSRTQESILIAMLSLLKELEYPQLLTLERELQSQKKAKDATQS